MSALVRSIEPWVREYGPCHDKPPGWVMDELAELIEASLLDVGAQERARRAEECVIAYGAGWGRTLKPESRDWGQRWLPALTWLTEHVWGWVRATAAWLHFSIHLPGYAFRAPFPSWQDAEALAHRLSHGRCDCWRLRDIDDHNARRRARRCVRVHHLTAWNPAEMSLRDFIARAVKGDKPRGNHSRQKGFVSGAVVQGMWFCDLYCFENVRFGKVLVWRCKHHPGAIFEGPECFKCAEAAHEMVFDEKRTKREVVRRFCVQGLYQPAQYWHCQNKCCDTYYRKRYHCCPRCSESRRVGAALSTVWVRGSSRVGVAPATGPDKQSTQELWNALEQLPPDRQALVKMKFFEDMTEEAIAQELSRPLHDVRSAIEKALRKLHRLLSPED